jgi:uncharacterized membrane protein
MSDWYYAVDNEQKGPINESELKANFATNKLPTDTLVWKDGMENWAPANQVAAFSFKPPPAPARVQPSPAAAAVPAPVVTETPAAGNPDSTTPVNLTSLLTAKGEALEVDPEDVENNRIFGIFAYLSILCLVPMFAAKNSPFARYHANQGLVLFLVEVALWIVLAIIYHIFEMLGLASLDFFLSLVWLGAFGFAVYGIINAAAGKCVPLPFIGGVKLLK